MLFTENDKKILYSNLESSTRVSSALLKFGITRTSGSNFHRHVVQNDNCSYNCVGGKSEVNTGNVSAVWR